MSEQGPYPGPYPNQPGQPYPPGPPTYPPAGPYHPGPGYQPPQPPRGRNRTPIILAALGVLVLVIIGGIFVAVNVLSDDIGDLEAGDCVTVSGSNSDIDVGEVSCTDTATLNYFISTKQSSAGGVCGGDFAEVVEPGDSGAKLCLVPNFQQGTCYSIPLQSLSGVKEVPCSAGGDSQINQVVKVLQRVDSTTVPDCPEPVTFDKPKPLGFCFGAP